MDMAAGAYGDELGAGLSAATRLLERLPADVHLLDGRELEAVLTAVDRLAAVAAAGRFTLSGEAEARGEVAASQAGSLAHWVRERCPSLDAPGAGVVAKAARELSAPTLAGVRAAVSDARLSVPAACVVASEWRQLAPLIEPEATDAVVAGLVAIGVAEGAAGVRALRPALLARYGLGQLLQEDEDRHAGLTVLSCGRDIGGGITEYRMRLNPEARAVVEAAINVLAAPTADPIDDASAHPVGATDLRTADQRRGSALVEVCRRAVAAGSTPPGGVKATVMVTIALDALRRRDRPGALIGGVDAGTLLGPETVRRLACDGAVLPVVVGPEGQPLMLGRSRRWFTPAQIRTLWLRDGHCTFTGCEVPATWCDAHHVRHWADGGRTDLDNAVLLCGRHHTVVHRDRLIAAITTSDTTSASNNASEAELRTGVVWDRTPGSYDRALARGPTARPAA